MEGENNTNETIVKTVVALIGIAAEAEYRARVLGTKLPDESLDALTMEQMNEQINNYRRQLESTISKNVAMVDKIVGFREKLKIRHSKTPDIVLARYEEFFELKDV